MRTPTPLTVTLAVACTALVGAVAFVARADDPPAAAVTAAAGQQAGASAPGGTASAAPGGRHPTPVGPAQRTHPDRRSHPRQGSAARQKPEQPQKKTTTQPQKKTATQPQEKKQTQTAATALPGPRFATVTAPDGGDVAVSPDGHAFTVTFSDAEVTLRQRIPHVTKTVPVVLHFAEGTRPGRVRLSAQGYTITENAKGYVGIAGAGQQALQGFGDGTDDSYLHGLQIAAEPGSTVRMSVTVDLAALPGKAGDGYLNVTSIDAEFV